MRIIRYNTRDVFIYTRAIMSTILVTGGAGYIGSHTVEFLIEQGHTVVVFDNLYRGHRQAVHPKAAFIQGDLLSRDQINAVFEQHSIDGVFHFASHIMVPESMEKPWLYLRDNVVAAANLLEAMVVHEVKRFILSSTAALFDKPRQIPIPADEIIVPGSPYGESKAMIERQLHWMDQIYGLKFCTLRYFNAAGAHPNGHIGEDHDPETHLIPLILKTALGQRTKIVIYGDDYDTPDGTCIRDYIHVLDLASAHMIAFEALANGKSLKYNLGTGQGYSNREVIDTARRVTGCSIPEVVGARRPGDLPLLVADNELIKKELGWQPRYSALEPIIETAWNWHRSHPQGFES
jgi:UDP-glucose 4-epimerase